MTTEPTFAEFMSSKSCRYLASADSVDRNAWRDFRNCAKVSGVSGPFLKVSGISSASWSSSAAVSSSPSSISSSSGSTHSIFLVGRLVPLWMSFAVAPGLDGSLRIRGRFYFCWRVSQCFNQSFTAASVIWDGSWRLWSVSRCERFSRKWLGCLEILAQGMQPSFL